MICIRIWLDIIHRFSSTDGQASPFVVRRLNTKFIMDLLCADGNKEEGDF